MVLPDRESSVKVVAVHGIFSSADVWAQLQEVLAGDGELSGRVDFLPFEYPSPKRGFGRTRKVPDINTIADYFGTFLDLNTNSYDRILVIAHSQGGLVVQRYLVRMIERRNLRKARQICSLIMYATPNAR